jgi:hypothetical protein
MYMYSMILFAIGGSGWTISGCQDIAVMTTRNISGSPSLPATNLAVYPCNWREINIEHYIYDRLRQSI